MSAILTLHLKAELAIYYEVFLERCVCVAVETGQEIGPVRARTCVPSKDFSKKTVSYTMCSKLSKELSASEIFSRIAVSRPQCTLCKKHLCTDASHC